MIRKIFSDWRYLSTIGVILLFVIKVYGLPERVTEVEDKAEDNYKAVTKVAASIDKYVEVQAVREDSRDKREKLLIEMIREQKKANGQ